MIWPFKTKTTYTPPPFEEIKKRAKILVIDDHDFVYAPLFTRDGYTIEKWDDVENLEKLENNYFDLILLDIQGVGQSESEEEGFGILKHIRAKSPTQIVIAFSNADWSLKYQDFFDLADRKLAKSQDYVEFKRVVDDLLTQRFNHNFYIDKIGKIQNLSQTEKTKIIQAARSSILSGKIETTNISVKSLSKEDAQLVLAIVQTAVTVCTL
jgi:CheY-like chemotaxis protein